MRAGRTFDAYETVRAMAGIPDIQGHCRRWPATVGRPGFGGLRCHLGPAQAAGHTQQPGGQTRRPLARPFPVLPMGQPLVAALDIGDVGKTESTAPGRPSRTSQSIGASTWCLRFWPMTRWHFHAPAPGSRRQCRGWPASSGVRVRLHAMALERSPLLAPRL